MSERSRASGCAKLHESSCSLPEANTRLRPLPHGRGSDWGMADPEHGFHPGVNDSPSSDDFLFGGIPADGALLAVAFHGHAAGDGDAEAEFEGAVGGLARARGIEEVLHMRQLLKTKLVDMDLSVRALNCLKAADVETLGELVTYNRNDLLKFRNFGKKSLTELDDLLVSLNLTFGMDISKYKLDKE